MDLYVIDWRGLDYVEDTDSSSSDQHDDEKEKVTSCPNEFLINAYCVAENGDSVVLNIKGFQPYFFVKVPDNWTDTQLLIFVNGLKGRVKKWFAATLVDYKIINAKPFYGFTAGDKFKFVKLSFTCYTGFNQYKYLLKDKLRLSGLNNGQHYQYALYESGIKPLLRFFHVNNLKATGWLHAKNAYKDIINRTTCRHSYTLNHTEISNVEKDLIPKLKYAAFDIEADSSHGDFPVAEKDYTKLARDIITEFNYLKQTHADMRPYIATFLKYAFTEYYNRNDIRRVHLQNQKTSLSVHDIIMNQNPYQEIIDAWAKPLYEYRTDQYAMMEILEKNFPALDTNKSDYMSVAEQLISNMEHLSSINDREFKESPINVVKVMLTLMLDPYFDAYGINRIYLHNTKQPLDKNILVNIVPSINKICDETYALQQKEKQEKRYRKAGIKIKKKNGPNPIDAKVAELSTLLGKHLPKVADDIVIQIGTTFKYYGDTDCYLKHIICLDTVDNIYNKDLIDFEYAGVSIPKKELDSELKTFNLPVGTSATELLEAKKQKQYTTDKATVIVEYYKTEEEVLLAWQRLITENDPDLLIGYNILQFDYKFLYDRAKQLGITSQFTQLSRHHGHEGALEEQNLSSAGMGENILYYIDIPGRISIDLYKVAQRMFQLENYKLDFICGKYLNKSKVDIEPKEIFIKQRGSSHDRMLVAQYCIIDCILCIRLLDKLDIIINNVGMSQVCSVPFSYLFLRGQGIKLLSLMAKKCREGGFLLPYVEPEENPEGYEGAIVLDPIKDIHYDVVSVADFNSLYPSCMISENLSHEMFIGSIQVKLDESTDFRGKPITTPGTLAFKYESDLLAGKYDGWDYLDIVYDIKKTIVNQNPRKGEKKKKEIITGRNICRFVQPPNNVKGVVPTILAELIEQRGASKDIRDKYPKGSFKYNVYEGLQLAYKTTGNSLYGFMGASTSALRHMEIAACTTATGRKLIQFTSNFVLKNYPNSKIIYGDTDSVFIRFDCRDRYGNKLVGLDAIYKSMELCKEAALRVSKQLRAPHNLEFEKAIFPFILVSKKRYHGHYYTKYGVPSYEAKSMGIVLKRRDNAKIVKHVFGGMIDLIMKEHSTEKAIKFVKDECTKVLKGEFPQEMFIVSKTIKSFYKIPDSIAHNVLAQRIGKRDPGNKPKPNDRISYAYIVNPDAELQGEKIETPVFINAQKMKLDYGHYIDKQISKPVAQIFELKGQGENLFKNLLTEYNLNMVGARRLTDAAFSKYIKWTRRPTAEQTL